MTDDRSMPPIAVRWVARKGDPRRIVVSALTSPRVLRRTFVIAAILSALEALICLISGSGGWIALLVFGIAVVGISALLFLCQGLGGYLRNKRTVLPESRWAAGADAAVLRIDTPTKTLLIDRSAIRSIARWRFIVTLTLRAGEVILVPAELLPVQLLGQ